MDYTITPSIDGTFITLKVKGNIIRQTIMKAILEAHALGRQLKVNRYLLDVTEAKNTEDTFGNYQFAYHDMQKIEGIDNNAHVAILVNPKDHSHDFAEIVSRNAGLNVRIFTDPVLAKKFLMYAHSPNKTI